MSEVEASAAYAELSKFTKRAYRVICAEIDRAGGGSAPVRAADIMAALHSNSTSAIATATRELRALKFVTVTQGRRGASVFALADGWRGLDPAEAKRLAAEARIVQARGPMARKRAKTRKSVEVSVVEAEPEQPRYRPVTLPFLPWPSPIGLRLLEERL